MDHQCAILYSTFNGISLYIFVYQSSEMSANHVITHDIMLMYDSCLGEVTIFCDDHTIFSNFKDCMRLYNLVQDFWEWRAPCFGSTQYPEVAWGFVYNLNQNTPGVKVAIVAKN